MVDIHHHLLWGVDDGAKDFETSVAMARAAAADGIDAIVATPHCNAQFPFDRELHHARVAELQAELDRQGIAVRVGLGSDFHLSYDNIQDARADPARFAVNGLGYLMVELPDYGIPTQLSETFYELQLAGLTPVLTHPERNATLQGQLDRMAEWLRGGLLLQVTADSVTGKMGKSAQKAAWELLNRRWVHFLATDAHNLDRRPPRLSEACAQVAAKLGTRYADSLVESNPRCVFEGKPFEPAEEPLHLYEEYREPGFFGRLFDRFRQ